MDIFVEVDQVWNSEVEITKFRSLFTPQIHTKHVLRCSKVILQQGDQIKIPHLYYLDLIV